VITSRERAVDPDYRRGRECGEIARARIIFLPSGEAGARLEGPDVGPPRLLIAVNLDQRPDADRLPLYMYVYIYI